LEWQGERRAKEGQRIDPEVELERVGRRQSGQLEEVRVVALEREPDEGLGDPRDAGNLGTAEIDTAETVPVGVTEVELRLEIDRVAHERRHLGVVDGRVGQSVERVDSLFLLPLAHEPPGGVRGEEDESEQRQGEHPLQSEWQAPSPFGRVVDEAVEDARTYQVTNHPAEIHLKDSLSAITPNGGALTQSEIRQKQVRYLPKVGV
jgi:hypothetical protein